MILSRLAFRLLPLLVALAAAPAGAEGLAPDCGVSGGLVTLHGMLPRTAERLQRHENLTIVALGSSSTAGTGASSVAANYPSQLAQELRLRFPEQSIKVINKGIGGETEIDMLRRFERDVFAENPDLVIWQVGTNSVLRDSPVAASLAMVHEGVEKLRAAGTDVILMDLQYAPAVLSHPLYREMERSLSQLGKEEGVPVFHRFAMMRHWVLGEKIGFGTILSDDGLHLNDTSYHCVGVMLGDAIAERAVPQSMTSHR